MAFWISLGYKGSYCKSSTDQSHRTNKCTYLFRFLDVKSYISVSLVCRFIYDLKTKHRYCVLRPFYAYNFLSTWMVSVSMMAAMLLLWLLWRNFREKSHGYLVYRAALVERPSFLKGSVFSSYLVIVVSFLISVSTMFEFMKLLLTYFS